jgi:diaminopimelate decarboxylase
MNWWENSAARLVAGRFLIAGRPAESWARRAGTPLFVYSRTRLIENCRRLRVLFDGAVDGDVRICYAMKANPFPPLLRTLRREGAWIDAVSPGEVDRARGAGFPEDRILFTGTSGSEDDFRRVLARPGIVLAVDAVEQVAVMRAALGRGRKGPAPRVSVRWNPGIGRGFNPKVITAGARSSDGTPIKFGVEESRVLDAYEAAAAAGFVPIGLHQHLGSGWTEDDYPSVAQAVDRMIDMAGQVRRAGFPLEFLDFGGGFGPRYAKAQKPFPVGRYARLLGRGLRRSGLGLRAIAVEPGKYLAADAGVLLLRVNYVKRSYGNLFACVDGGTFNTLPRPAVYGAAHEVINATRPAGRRAPVTVAGHLCETGDVFAKDAMMAVPEAGDLLAVLCAGAYGRSMASEFNLRPIAGETLA